MIKTFPLTILIFASLLSSDGAWASKLCASRLPALPEHLSNNAVTSVQNADGGFSLYTFTGLDGETASRRATLEAYRLNTTTGEWTQLADAPGVLGFRPKVGANAITVAGEVYLLGGYTVRSGEVTEKELYRYDAATDTYEQLAPVPTQVDDTVVGVYQDRYIYTVSGWHGPINDNVLNVQIYDTLTNEWQQASQLPGPNTGLFGHSGTLINDRVIVVDGVKSAAGFSLSDLVFVGQIDPNDLTSISWQQLPAHPGLATYRAAASQAATTDGRMLLLGGSNNPYNFNSSVGYNGEPSYPLAQGLLFNPVSGGWEELLVEGEVLATMDHRGLVALGDDSWATIGGMDAPGLLTDQVVMYQLVADDHVCTVPEPSGGVILCGAWLVWLRRRLVRLNRQLNVLSE